ncbi:hypothetical protein [Streptomyces rubiginosohelvolus]|uniref:hypothetical protein n=1 Tax=Streptomyces rubiginosohelvolus TaxID=67362 RepID=UPI0035E231F8
MRDILGRVAPVIPLIAAAPDARPDVDTARAADLLYGLLSPELYLIFTRDRDWSPDVWEAWARTALLAQLCKEEEWTARPSGQPRRRGMRAAAQHAVQGHGRHPVDGPPRPPKSGAFYCSPRMRSRWWSLKYA